VTVSELKTYIYENNKIEYVLEQLNCHHIQYHSNKEYYSCGNPDGDNNNAVIVRNNEYLNTINYTRNLPENSDIIDLISLYKKCDFKSVIKWLYALFGLTYSYHTDKNKDKNDENKIDPLDIFKRVKKKRYKVDVSDIEIIDEEILNDFIPHIHIKWFREGIIKRTIDKFQLGYSYQRQRCIIPIRYWQTGELMGITGRTMIENYDMFDIAKYLAIKPYQKSLNLYGLWENYDSIQKAGYVVVYESEKSVLKRHSRLDETGVAVGCHDISDEQVRILIGLNVDIIIAMDNDVPQDKITVLCKKFKGIRNVYYIKDEWKLLGEKDSPADVHNKVFEFLLKHKKKY
jgi:hypothetical protein